MPTYTSPTAHTLTGAAGTLTTQGYGLAYNYLREAFLAAGWVQTADTGQYQPVAAGSTTSPPAQVANANGASWGYLIFRMNDALQATKPVFVKLGFAGGNSAFTSFTGLHFEIGEGSNGAGALTGRRVGRNLLWATSSAAGLSWTTALETRAAGSPGEFFLSFHEPSSAAGVTPTDLQSMWLSIERTRGADGAVDGEGVLVACSFNAQPTQPGHFQYTLTYPTNGTIAADTEANVGFIRGGILPVRSRDFGVGSINQGNVLGPFIPTHFGLFPKYRQTRLGFLYPHNDIPWNTTFKLEVNGVERTFRAAGWPQGRHLYANSNLAALGFSTFTNGADWEFTNRPMALAHLWE